MHTKPPTSSADNFKKPGVYSVPCGDCNLRYVGETGRSLEVRLKVHKDSVRLGRSNNAIFSHVQSTNHNINWSDVKLLYKSDKTYNRLIVESTIIKHVNNFNHLGGLCSIDNHSKNLIIKSLPSIVHGMR